MNKSLWQPEFYKNSIIFNTIADFAKAFSKLQSWPGLDQLNAQFKKHNQTLVVIPQMKKAENFEQLYESRIYLQKQLQTRTENWHDFFNALCWLSFPETKKTLNQFHYQRSLQRKTGSNRSPLENAMALFDECGLIIISDQQHLLDMFREHQWQTLFIEHKSDFNKHLRCINFGHAMYEKALTPYIGMTAHAVLIHSESLLEAHLSEIDQALSTLCLSGKIHTTRSLQAVPILGIPGWHAQKQDDEFYANSAYFRQKTAQK